MLLRFSDALMEKHGETIFEYIPSLSINKILTYVLNSDYRKAIILKDWIKRQVENPTEIIQQIVMEITSSDDYDRQMDYIYRWVKSNFHYLGDPEQWKMSEYWQTAEESLTSLQGDCEDGAILQYVLARLKGIPANRLLLFCGWVQNAPTAKQGGHCYLGYKPKNYPLNWAFVDWCYYGTNQIMDKRNLFTVIQKKTFEFVRLSENECQKIDSRYKDIWFAFNENMSFTEMRTKK